MCNTPLVKDTPPSFIRDFVNDDIVRDGTCVFGMEFKTNGKKKGRTNNNNKKSNQNNKIKFEMFSHQRHRDRGRLVYTSGWIYNLPWGYTVTRKCIIRCCCLGTWRQYFSIHFSRLFPDSSRQLCVCVCGGVWVCGPVSWHIFFFFLKSSYLAGNRNNSTRWEWEWEWEWERERELLNFFLFKLVWFFFSLLLVNFWLSKSRWAARKR